MKYDYHGFTIEILVQATGEEYGYRITEDGILVDQSGTGIAARQDQARKIAEDAADTFLFLTQS